MRPRVTAIVVGQNAATALTRTLPALEAQTCAPNRTVMVDLGSRDRTEVLMRNAGPDKYLRLDDSTTFPSAIQAAVDYCNEADAEERERRKQLGVDPELSNDWYWILGADNAPEPDALDALLDTAERNPSLEVTGPKIVHSDDPARIVEYGESLTHSGIAVRLHQDAIDQGQFEHLSDVLAVAAGGMLVRRDTWDRLNGFDEGLDAVDDGLDFCVRTWLSGGRVLLTPRARVEASDTDAMGTTHFGRRTRPLQKYRIRRQAQLHRQLSWSSLPEFILRWLFLLPQTLLRSIMHLLRKTPGRIIPDWRAALRVWFFRTGVLQSRKQFAATKQHSTQSLSKLFVSPGEWRKLQANKRDEYRAATQQHRDRYNFITGGGGWIALFGCVLSLVLLFPLVHSATITGGALLPLSGNIAELWGNTGYGLRDTGGGVGVADPFNYLLAFLGTTTFWEPSQSIHMLWLIAIPASGIGAWFLAARLTERPWPRAIVALTWMMSPTLFSALMEGRLSGVIVHLVLPWLLFTGIGAASSWAAAACCSLLALIVAACSPMLLPLLVVLWLIALPLAGRGWVRIFFASVPTLVMFMPLGITHLNRGRPFAVFADPGLPVIAEPTRGWEVLTLFPTTSVGGWRGVIANISDNPVIWWMLVLLLIPLVALAISGLFTRTWRVALAGIALACGGFVVAGIAGGFSYAFHAGERVPLWIGSAQSVALLGLLIAAAAGMVALRLGGTIVGVIGALAIVALALPIAPAQLNGNSQVAASTGRTLPALVEAQGAAANQLGTLVITPLGSDRINVHLERGAGQTMNEFSTLSTTNTELTETDRALAETALQFLSDGAANPTAELHDLGIGFVLVEPAPTAGAVLEQRLVTAMSTNEALSTAGEVDKIGTLFQVKNAAERPTDPALAGALDTDNLKHGIGRALLIVQGLVMCFVILLALPTGGIEARARGIRQRRGRKRWFDLDRGTTRTELAFDSPADLYQDQPTGEHIDMPGGDRDDV
ncbi:glycosyltransferase family 2 protein [Gulosibacter bifidus]|uniref:Glycosyltransferase family 2 protein n=1 Tax=Gulosibacter bifidus TaxID=272239 RepID=A0ABW5RI11_9MICO|nr:glycosyltransferase [Gulosibacter bifidus]